VETIFPYTTGLLLLTAVVVAALSRYAFIIRIRPGRPRVLKGKVTVAFLEELGQVCAECGVRHGWVGGVRRRDRRATLRFSWGIPRGCRQRLRNLWALHQ
jgi:hypothetical protein